ncbi:SDR family oxidoreductase [Thermodesulfobacteriota bacterium]
MTAVRFDGRVAIITGAGGGLGRAHALLLGSRGAKIVVNDMGGNSDGTGEGTAMADQVCEEIKVAGGEAVPNYDSVVTAAGGENIVRTAMGAFGRVDILINNAGILRDSTFIKMAEEDWDNVIGVHLKGSYNVTKAAWPIMREMGYGRIIMTTSSAGLFGNFGQANYGSAKMGVVGLMNVLKQEGGKYNILINTIAPVAGTRMTAAVLPPDLKEKLKAEFVSLMVAWLCSEGSTEQGSIFTVGGGYFARVALVEGAGFMMPPTGKTMTIEDIRDNFDKIANMEGAKEYNSAMEEMSKAMGNPSS